MEYLSILTSTSRSPTSGELPLGNKTKITRPSLARRAVAVASSYLARLLPDAESWSVEKVSLQRAGGKSDTNWVYVIEFTGPLASGSSQLGGMVHTFAIVVLMNGVPVEPRISIAE